MQTLHCNPGFENKPPVFDPVVIETWPEQTGLKSMPFYLHSLAATDICTMPEYQIAHICFVFSPMSNVQPRSTILALDNLYAFVLWFEPISCLLPHSRFRTVQKMKVRGQQATGVVCKTDIKFSCELTLCWMNHFGMGQWIKGSMTAAHLTALTHFISTASVFTLIMSSLHDACTKKSKYM